MNIVVGNREIDLGSSAAVMAILNITPDSFFERSRTFDIASISTRVDSMINEGADIIDLGGYSSRPSADDVAVEEEIRRVSLGVEAVRYISDIPISIDTFRAEVVEAIYSEFGPFIINDITGGSDERMFEVAAKYSLPYVCMHMRGTPQTMQSMTDYDNIVEDIDRYFEKKIAQMRESGIEQIVIDPGFGFAKTTEQNYELFAGMETLNRHQAPILIGVSRKSMIYKPLECKAEQALTGTTILNWEALKRGAKILRVHDTREAVDTVKMFNRYKDCLL